MATSGSSQVTVTSHDTLTFSWSLASQNVAENYSVISWSIVLSTDAYGRINSTATKNWSANVNGSGYSGNNTVGIGNSTSKTLATGSTTIYHNADGTKSFSYSFSQYFAITFSGSYIGTVSGSGSGTLPTIPRATTPSLSPSAVTMGKVMEISLPRASNSFTHTLQYDFQTGAWTTFATEATTSGSLTIPLAWADKVPNDAQGTGKIRCLTYNGSTLVGEKIINFTALVPDDVIPTVDTITVTEGTDGIAAKFGGFVQNKSMLKIVSEGSGVQGSTIASYKVEVQGISYTGSDVMTHVITVSGKVDVKVTVVDSRSRQGSKTVQVSLMEYFTPTITTFNAFRAGADGVEQNGSKTLKCVFDFTIATCGNKNDKGYKIEYKKDSETTWTTLHSGSLYTANTSYMKEDVLELEYSYNVRFTVTDYFTSAVYELKVGTEIVPLCVYPSGKGLGIGGYPTKEALQVFFATELYNKSLKFMGTEEDEENPDLDVYAELKALRQLVTAQQEAITQLNSKSSETVTVTINGRSMTFYLHKRSKIVYCRIAATGSLSSNSAVSSSAVIPEGYRPIMAVYLTAMNVTGANFATNYGCTRYIIGADGKITVTSNQTEALERSVSGCWVIE